MKKIADTCKLPDCSRKYDSIGYCGMHAQRFRRHGDTEIVKKKVLKDYRWKEPEYKAWVNMRQRCTNEKKPQYDDWGGRGIKVCQRWGDYFNFLNDMGRRPSTAHSLDRIDNDGNYEPSNCRWATRSEQMKNRRPMPSRLHLNFTKNR